MNKSDIKNRISNWVLLRAILLAIFSVQLGSLAQPPGSNQIATSYVTSGKTFGDCTKEQRKIFFVIFVVFGTQLFILATAQDVQKIPYLPLCHWGMFKDDG